jgi:hypothetical protein
MVAIACGVVGCGKSIQEVCPSSSAVLIGPNSATLWETTTQGTYSLDFGLVAVGQKAGVTLRLSDVGPYPLQILSVGAPSDAEFALTLTPGTTLQPCSSVDVPIIFQPFSAGSRTGVVVLQTDSVTRPTVTLNLKGTGVKLEIAVTPTLLDFGAVVVHSQKSLQVVLTNHSALDVFFTPGPIQGNAAPLFTIDTTNAFVLPANSTKTINVSYSPVVPSSGALDTASFVLSSSTGGPVTVILQGIAAQSGLEIIPNPLDFNFIQPGASLRKTLKILNVGNDSVTISSASVVNAGVPQAAFSSTQFDGTLAPGEEAEVSVTFQPATHVYSRYTGELDVVSNDNLGQTSVTLTGWGGGAAISCTPRLLDFGAVKVGSRATLPVMCTNTGSDVMINGAIDPRAELIFDPSHPLLSSSAAFAAAFDPPASGVSLVAGASVRIDVSYLPAAVGVASGTLTVVTNVTNPPAPPVIDLRGIGQ